MVGLARVLSLISNLDKNNIVRDLPHPVVPQYVPPLPSPFGLI
jgi:hypothetical protein